MTGCQIDLYKNCVTFSNGLTVLTLQTFDSSMALLTSSERVYFPPHSETLLSVRLTGRAAECFDSATAIIEPYIAAHQRGILEAKVFVNNSKNGKLPCRVLNPFNKPCTIPRGFAVTTLSHAVLITNSDKPTLVQHCPRQMTPNLSQRAHADQTRKQASNSGSQPRNIVAACSSSNNNNSSKLIEEPLGRSDSEAILQRTFTTQQTSDSGEYLHSARAQFQVPVTSLEKVLYLKSKGFSLNTCAAENDTFSEFINSLYDYQDIFAYSETDIPECNLLKCYLSTYPDAKPSRCRPYRLSDNMKVQVDKQLDQLLASGVIAEDNGSPFASPIVMIKKIDNSWRFCVNFRRLNAISISLFYELLQLYDILDLMTRNKAKCMTTLDMRQAYHQLGITEESSYITTFITPHRRSYKYLRLPQGHSHSPYWMTVALNQLFRHQVGTYMLIYLDDIICISESPAQHLKHLQSIFEKFRGAYLKLHLKKCNFFSKLK